MLYAVEKYMDQIRQKTTARSDDHYIYFESEEEAKKFIRDRAVKEYLKAEASMKKAWQRMARARKKFAASR